MAPRHGPSPFTPRSFQPSFSVLMASQRNFPPLLLRHSSFFMLPVLLPPLIIPPSPPLSPIPPFSPPHPSSSRLEWFLFPPTSYCLLAFPSIILNTFFLLFLHIPSFCNTTYLVFTITTLLVDISSMTAGFTAATRLASVRAL